MLRDIIQVSKMSTQYNVRLPDGTAKQIQKLIEVTGMTQTQLMIVAIDRMSREEERTKQMINHEVTLIGFDGDINEVNAALVNAGIQTNPEEAESRGKESSVFVSPMQIGEAVRVINDLGYETDEDDEDAE